MIIQLSNIAFKNDFFSTMLSDGGRLYLCRLNESIATESDDFVVNQIIIEKVNSEGELILVSSIINFSDGSGISVKSDYDEYSSDLLTEDNMAYCYIEVEE